MDVLEEDNPQSVRHVFYRMTNSRLAEPVEKSDRGYRHVQSRVLALRRSGCLPYGWISDATRRGHFVDTFADPADFLRRVNSLYRADMWVQTPYCCEIWTESRSIAGVIQRDCRELAVSLYPCGGFTSATLAYEAVENIAGDYDSVDWRIFYIGDYDPAGVLIDVKLEHELRRHLAKHTDKNIELTFERIGITAEQITEFALPTNVRKASDRRSKHVAATVEAEAMPARILRSIVRERIEALLPPNALAVAKVADEDGRKALDLVALAMQGSAAG